MHIHKYLMSARQLNISNQNISRNKADLNGLLSIVLEPLSMKLYKILLPFPFENSATTKLATIKILMVYS